MTDLTKPEAEPEVAAPKEPKPKPKKPNPLAFFLLPIVETISLLVWWLYATTHVVDFPGQQTYSDGDSSNGNVVIFNIILVVILAVSWIAANWYYEWKKDN